MDGRAVIYRYDLINHLCGRYAEPAYLEIGCRDDDCFRRVQAATKVGVDPNRGGTLRMTSDEYFASYRGPFDVVFIDGLHFSEQVRRDFNNARRCLTPGGVIVLHDCLPDDEHHQDPDRARPMFADGAHDPDVGRWTGDVWRVVVELASSRDVDVAMWPGDCGCGLATIRPARRTLMNCPTFADYQARWRNCLAVLANEAEIDAWLENSNTKEKV